MDPEMQGIFDRADELTRELAREYETCAQLGEVSERARNLFHEALLKVRSALDFAMNRVFDKHTTLSDEQKTKTAKRVYFPIFEQLEQFNGKLEQYGLSHLEQSKPDLYRKIQQPQPFATKRDDLLLLKKLSDLGKHVHLAVQKCQRQKGKQVTKPDGAVMMFTEGVTFHHNGKQIDPSAYGEVQDIMLATFDVQHGYKVISEPQFICMGYCMSYRRYVDELLALL